MCAPHFVRQSACASRFCVFVLAEFASFGEFRLLRSFPSFYFPFAFEFSTILYPPRSLHGSLVLVGFVDLMRSAVLPRDRWTSTSIAAAGFLVNPCASFVPSLDDGVVSFQRASALALSHVSMFCSPAMVVVLDARKRDERRLRWVGGLGARSGRRVSFFLYLRFFFVSSILLFPAPCSCLMRRMPTSVAPSPR